MSDDDDLDITWHTGLHARLSSSFPKKCTNCGRIFETVEQYFNETIDISEQDRGFKSFVDDDTATVVEAFRNCTCGSTLMEMFDDLRDSSEEEIARKTREEEIAKSMRVADPFADIVSAASPADSTIVNDDRRSEMQTADGPRISSYEDLAASVENGLSELDQLNVEEKWTSEWYSGLRPKGESAYPKTCGNCGRVYETPDDFFTETGNIKPEDTGLRASNDEVGGVIVEAFRNCLCGSTLMENFADRRDMSPAGHERRERFDQMLNYLVEIGLNADTAYTELLNVARGGESNILAKIKPPEQD